MDKVICHDCGKECVSNGFSSGYGIDEHGDKFCYECCGKRDRRDLENAKIGDRFCFYLCEKYNPDTRMTEHFVTNWPATLSIRVWPRKGSHNIAGVRYDVWFSIKGNNFHGVNYGNNSQICHIRCVK